MKIGILLIGQVDPDIITRIQENLCMSMPEHAFTRITEPLPLPPEACDEEREQYRSNIILTKIRTYAEETGNFERVLGIVDVDIYLTPLNFVFGEAESPGKAALISLWRLRPEFYKSKPKSELFIERSAKEAVHELGHTRGLKHCSNPFCVMYFSNSIFETDRKQSLFCNKCYLRLERTKDQQEENVEHRP
jgi:archaemetzincin